MVLLCLVLEFNSVQNSFSLFWFNLFALDNLFFNQLYAISCHEPSKHLKRELLPSDVYFATPLLSVLQIRSIYRPRLIQPDALQDHIITTSGIETALYANCPDVEPKIQFCHSSLALLSAPHF